MPITAADVPIELMSRSVIVRGDNGEICIGVLAILNPAAEEPHVGIKIGSEVNKIPLSGITSITRFDDARDPSLERLSTVFEDAIARQSLALDRQSELLERLSAASVSSVRSTTTLLEAENASRRDRESKVYNTHRSVELLDSTSEKSIRALVPQYVFHKTPKATIVTLTTLSAALAHIYKTLTRVLTIVELHPTSEAHEAFRSYRDDLQRQFSLLRDSGPTAAQAAELDLHLQHIQDRAGVAGVHPPSVFRAIRRIGELTIFLDKEFGKDPETPQAVLRRLEVASHAPATFNPEDEERWCLGTENPPSTGFPIHPYLKKK